jgi:hypothetical protein
MWKPALSVLVAVSACVAALGVPSAAARQADRVFAHYDVYAAGIELGSAEVTLALGANGYQVEIRYRTAGVVGALFPGRQHSSVTGAWNQSRPMPHHYHSAGQWRGKDYLAVIDYDQERPAVRALLPSLDEEREPVPDTLRHGAIDTLSALAELMRLVDQDNRCDGAARLFDGRRASAVQVRSAGQEVVPVTTRSPYAGMSLRCDFEARVLAGFRRGDDAAARRRPFVGSAWFARPLAEAPPVPTRINFETRLLGTARLYLTRIVAGAPTGSAAAGG